MNPFYVYDIETYPNIFLFTGKFEDANEHQVFEISSRRNDRSELLSWLNYLQNTKSIQVGYNNLSFDYPVIHNLLTNPYTFDYIHAFSFAQNIISQGFLNRFGSSIRLNDRFLPQLDLMKVHHFDNVSKSTSLKALQFAMRSESVEDLPYEIRNLAPHEMDELRKYNLHDVLETERFKKKSDYAIKIRQELLENGILTGDVLNYSDVKIGTEYLVRKIGRSKCFVSGSTPRQTIRSQVEFSSIILPKIHFRTEPFNAVLDWFKKQIVYKGSEERPRLEAKLANLSFHFGVGGVHASVENKVYQTTDTHIIKDVDVAGMYPAILIANGFAPEHLGKDFTATLKQVSADRKQHAKGSAMNLTLKLAGNGVTGNLNNDYSCFKDEKCYYSMTINGQLQALQLAELLALVPGVELIQANTDGVTAYVPREVEQFFDLWCNEWECQTGLKLEHAPYKRMWIRDVNNYLAEKTDREIKRKGAYWYPIKDEDYQGSSGSNWNKDFSNMSAQKCVEACLTRGLRPEDAVRLISDPFDFMLRYKTTGGSKVFIGAREMQKTVRYYVSTCGEKMRKVATPKGEIGTFKRKNSLKDSDYQKILSEIPAGTWDERIHTKNKSKYEMTETSIESGWLIKECNRASDFDWNDVDFSYYEEQVRKLMI